MMFVGHLALCGLFIYLFYRLNVKNFSIPIALIFSILPDVDIIINLLLPFLIHKTITHSIFILIFFLILFFIVRNKLIILYSVFYLTHFLGDMIIEKVNLFFPFFEYNIGTGIKFISETDILIESSLLIVNVVILCLDKNYLNWIRNSYLQRKKTNEVLTYFVCLSLAVSTIFIISQTQAYIAMNPILIMTINFLTALTLVIGTYRIFHGHEEENINPKQFD